MRRMEWRPALTGTIWFLAAATVWAQPPSVAELMRDPAVQAALEAARTGEPRTIDDQIRFCEVPAPSFAEGARAEVLRREFVAAGLQNVRVDRAGNVLGDRPGATARPRLVVAAHLDTVFPEGTDVAVERDGAVLRGPGIGDNCRGLAVLVSTVRALGRGGVRTPGSITFVANVGEEGLGDLRGAKTLFGETMKNQIDRFLSIDGGGVQVTTVGVGSYRYRVTFRGPGGHSFGAFGLANPINALGRAVGTIAEFHVPAQPRTTFNVGRIGGGTSVNSIPHEAWLEVDIRSSDTGALAAVDRQFHAAVDRAVEEENARWGKTGVVTATKELVGNRPAGATPVDAPIVVAAQAVGRALGLSVQLGEGSSDSNIPMRLGVPAITIGGGGSGSQAHSPDESFDTTESWKGTANAVLVTIALAQK